MSEEQKTWKELDDGEITIMPLMKVQSMMSGVQYISQNHEGTVTLRYTDGTSEQASIPNLELSSVTNLFSVVSAVQSIRRSKEVNQ